MKITANGKNISLSTFSAELYEKNLNPFTLEVIKYKYSSMLTQKHVKTTTSAYNLDLVFLFTAENHQKTLKNMMLFIDRILSCSIKMDSNDDFENENLNYECIMNSYEFEFIKMNEALLKINFDCEIYGPLKRIKLKNEDQVLFIGGARDTFVSFSVKAKSELRNFALSNFVIKKLSEGKTLFIDSEKMLMTVDGSLYMKRNEVGFTEFLITHGFYNINIDSGDADVFVMFKERW